DIRINPTSSAIVQIVRLSIKNCLMMPELEKPMAFKVPISLALPLTLTNIEERTIINPAPNALNKPISDMPFTVSMEDTVVSNCAV
ncbi:unnamed protein product, partial [marine sediment metagenome]